MGEENADLGLVGGSGFLWTREGFRRKLGNLRLNRSAMPERQAQNRIRSDPRKPDFNCAAKRRHRESSNGADRSESGQRARNGPQTRERRPERVAWAYCVVLLFVATAHSSWLVSVRVVHTGRTKDDAASRWTRWKRNQIAILTERLLFIRGGDLRHFRRRFSVHELN